MPARPTFQRAPRISPEIPGGEVEIPPPPPLPSAPPSSLVATILPRLSALGGLVVIVVLVLQQYANPALIALPVSITFLSVGAAVYTHVSQKRGRERAVKERETKYRAMLQTRGRDLMAQRDRQLAALYQIDPSPQELLPLVERRDRRMWQRSPRDPDFLLLRAGLGMQPFAVTVKP